MLEKWFKLPVRLIQARALIGEFSDKFINRYMKCFVHARTVRLQRGYNEIFYKFAKSPTWQKVCQQVFDQCLGQYSFTPASQINFLAEKLNITSQSHVLDLGCGVGGLSCYLAKVSGCQVKGVDASPMAIKIANEQAMLQGLAERVSFEVGILPELPYEDRSFDAVISVDSVYGIPDKDQLFHRCYQTLKKGGRIGFYTLYKKKKFSAEASMYAQALYWFPFQPYHYLLKKAGFKDVSKIDLTEDFLEITRRWIKAIQENKELLAEELGKETTEGLLNGDIRIALVLAEKGLIGRALFKGQKPYKG